MTASPVPEETVADTLLELEQRFGAVSCETQSIRGNWRHEGEFNRQGGSKRMNPACSK